MFEPNVISSGLPRSSVPRVRQNGSSNCSTASKTVTIYTWYGLPLNAYLDGTSGRLIHFDFISDRYWSIWAGETSLTSLLSEMCLKKTSRGSMWQRSASILSQSDNLGR